MLDLLLFNIYTNVYLLLYTKNKLFYIFSFIHKSVLLKIISTRNNYV